MSRELSKAGLAQEWVVAHRTVPDETGQDAAESVERRRAYLAARGRWHVEPKPADLAEARVLPGQEGSPLGGYRIIVGHEPIVLAARNAALTPARAGRIITGQQLGSFVCQTW